MGSLLFADISRLSENGKLAVRPTQVSRVEAAQQVSDDLIDTEYIIIDGQQRAIAVALGLRRFELSDSARLWIDLGAGAENLFSVCTIQKPWGRDATRAQIAAAKLRLTDVADLSWRIERDIPPFNSPGQRAVSCPCRCLAYYIG